MVHIKLLKKYTRQYFAKKETRLDILIKDETAKYLICQTRNRGKNMAKR